MNETMRKSERNYEALWLQVEVNHKKNKTKQNKKTKKTKLICCAYRAPDESLEILNYLDDILHKSHEG